MQNTYFSFDSRLSRVLIVSLLLIAGAGELCDGSQLEAAPQQSYVETDPCYPDCEQSPWGPPQLVEITIPPYGKFWIKYRTRYACETYYDVYIDWFMVMDAAGQSATASLAMNLLLEIVTWHLLVQNPMQFPPFPDGSQQANCHPNWRVVKGQCWSRVDFGDPDCPIQYVACEEKDCCLERYEVCINPATNERVLTKTSAGTITVCTNYVQPQGGAACQPACGYPIATPEEPQL